MSHMGAYDSWDCMQCCMSYADTGIGIGHTAMQMQWHLSEQVWSSREDLTSPHMLLRRGVCSHSLKLFERLLSKLWSVNSSGQWICQRECNRSRWSTTLVGLAPWHSLGFFYPGPGQSMDLAMSALLPYVILSLCGSTNLMYMLQHWDVYWRASWISWVVSNFIYWLGKIFYIMLVVNLCLELIRTGHNAINWSHMCPQAVTTYLVLWPDWTQCTCMLGQIRLIII